MIFCQWTTGLSIKELSLKERSSLVLGLYGQHSYIQFNYSNYIYPEIKSFNVNPEVQRIMH